MVNILEGSPTAVFHAYPQLLTAIKRKLKQASEADWSVYRTELIMIKFKVFPIGLDHSLLKIHILIHDEQLHVLHNLNINSHLSKWKFYAKVTEKALNVIRPKRCCFNSDLLTATKNMQKKQLSFTCYQQDYIR